MTRKGALSDEIQSLRSEYKQYRLEFKTLQGDLEYMRKMTLDWETRSRICQGAAIHYCGDPLTASLPPPSPK